MLKNSAKANRTANANARSIRAEKRMGRLESSATEKGAFSKVDPEIMDEVKAKVELMNPDKSNYEAYTACVNMAIVAVNAEKGTDYKAIESRVQKRIEQNKKIKSTQPEVNNKSKGIKKAKPLSDGQKAMADRYKISYDDYYDSLPARARIG